MSLRHTWTVLVVWSVAAPALAQSRQVYLDLAESAYRESRTSCRVEVEHWLHTWQPDGTWGYAPPGAPVWLAGLAGALYDLTGNEAYAEEAAVWLAEYQHFKSRCPASLRQRPEYAAGVPTLTDFFHLPVFAQAYLHIAKSPAVTAARRAQIEAGIADSADFIRHTPEWGPMNRAILRALGLTLAARALPDHPHAAAWRKLAAVLARDSWGQWTEEDAEIYHPVWLAALIHYADAIGDTSLFTQHTVRYYSDYFLQLLSPAGMVPDFGDARWNENWAMYVACLERAAREYRSPHLKWGAARILTALTGEHGARPDARAGLSLIDAYRWADDGLTPQPPPARSAEVLEELIGKKIVFRTGWDAAATYLLLNYRDEGPFARTPRDYLRQTILAEEERVHHAHADENSICLLMDRGSVLLHDAGYRDRLPSGPYGAYRADYFHNRLVARRDMRDREQPLYEFLRYSGAYNQTTTEKIDFFVFPTVEMSRTRLNDPRTGYAADRVVVYLKESHIFLVFDFVKILSTDFYTFATLWHGTTVLAQGPRHYVTAVDAIGTFHPPQTQALLIDFLVADGRPSGSFPIQRYWQDETAVYQTISSQYRAGQMETFVTALVPHARGTDVQPLLDSVQLLEVDKPRHGAGVAVRHGDDVQYVCVKGDLELDLLPENVRPRYSYDRGRIQYGPLETDASFLYAHRRGDTLSYAAANMVKVVYEGRVVFAARPTTSPIQVYGPPTREAPQKWRCWEDTLDLRQPETAPRWP